ncbi:MAG: type IIL restriction-modification enzyme MmeI [Myxococcota bacterium]
MPISWNEIRKRAIEFSQEWHNATRENAEAQSFYNDFFNVFGISRRRVATFEEPVKKLGDKRGRMDLFWKGVLLVEQKSAGKDLAKAKAQALDYFPHLKEEELPRYVLVSNFQRFQLYDLEQRTHVAFALKDLHKNVEHFGFIAGYQKREFKDQDPVNIEASELMGRLHDQLKEVGYEGDNLELLLVRLLFCLFANDTGIFEKGIFTQFIEQRTQPDGSDLGSRLAHLFQTLNKPHAKRAKTLDEDLARFPYVNGALFERPLLIAAFNSRMRTALLKGCYFNWSFISPAIFGSLFQSVMDKQKRRGIGAHYTTEQNILKVIRPLFLDGLYAEFAKVKHNRKRLLEFHKKLGTLRFFDPACGCGNFLIMAYRELRELEIQVLQALYPQKQRVLDVSDLSRIDVDQFYGIELEEFPAHRATSAMRAGNSSSSMP